jgi:hypothetical protein
MAGIEIGNGGFTATAAAVFTAGFAAFFTACFLITAFTTFFAVILFGFPVELLPLHLLSIFFS